MGRITEITPQKKNKSRVNLYIDNEFVCGLELLTLARNRLKVGDEITETELNAIIEESEAGTAFDKALKFATYRPRTEREIGDFLNGKGYTDAIKLATLAKLKEYGYCDDYAFCREYVRLYSGRDGIMRMRFNMRKLGAVSAAIDAALDGIEEQADAAFGAAEKYIRTHSKFDMRKMKAYLYSRGFARDDIDSAAARVADEYDLDDDDDFTDAP